MGIASATVRLTVRANSVGTYANETINLYAVTAANANWVEGTGNDAGAEEAGAST